MASRSTLYLALLAATAVCGLYASAAWNHGFIYDDHLYIREAAPVHSPADAARIFTEPHPGHLPYYRALTRLTLQLQKAWHGDNPRPFHLFNAALAGAVLLAAYGLLRHPSLRLSPALALAAALVFTLHPVASECVYPSDSGRETLLPALLILLCVRLWLAPGPWAYLGSIALFALALTAKEQALMTPIILVACDRLLHAHWPRLRRILPILLISLAYLGLRRWLYHGSDAHLTVFQHPFEPFRSILFGLQSMFAPRAGLAYEPPFQVWFSPLRTACALLCATALLVQAWRRRVEIGNVSLFWFIWFIAFQLPTAQLVRQEAAYSERYVFVSLLGILGLIAVLVPQLWCGRPACTVSPPKTENPTPTTASQARPHPALILFYILILLCALLSAYRARFYRNDTAFYTQWARTNPAAPVAHMGLGRSHAARGDWPAAAAAYTRAITLKPDYAGAWNNLGRAQDVLGQRDLAIASFRRALSADPRSVDASNNLAADLAEAGQLEEALSVSYRALQLQPDLPATYNNLGGVLLKSGRVDAAMQAWEKGLSLDPNQLQPHLNLALLLLQHGRLTDARAHLQSAKQIAPADPSCKLVEEMFAAQRVP